MADERLGTLAELYAGKAPRVVALCEALRQRILARDPDAFEWASPREKTTNFGVGPRKMIDGYAYVMLLKDRVNLGFFRGTSLPDPEGLLEGTGKALRHVKIAREADADRPAVLALIAAAVAERRAAP